MTTLGFRIFLPPDGGYNLDEYTGQKKDTDENIPADKTDRPENSHYNRKKRKKSTVIILSVAAAVVILTAVFFGMNYFKNGQAGKTGKLKEIELKDYIKVEFDGYDGRGKADVMVDKDMFIEDVLKAVGTSQENKRAFNNAEDLYYSIYAGISDNYGLSNGDKAEVDADWNEGRAEKAGVRMVFTPYKVEVSGLLTEEPQTYYYEPDNEMVRDINDISNYTISEAQNRTLSELEDMYGDSISDISYKGAYFISPYFSDDDYADNYFYPVYEGTITGKDGSKQKEYIAYGFFGIEGYGNNQIIDGEAGMSYDSDGNFYTDEEKLFDALTDGFTYDYIYQVSGELTDFGRKVRLPDECRPVVEELSKLGEFTCNDGFVMASGDRDVQYRYDGKWDIRDYVSEEVLDDDIDNVKMMNIILKSLSRDGNAYTESLCPVSVNSIIDSFYFEKDSETGKCYMVYKFTGYTGFEDL